MKFNKQKLSSTNAKPSIVNALEYELPTMSNALARALQGDGAKVNS